MSLSGSTNDDSDSSPSAPISYVNDAPRSPRAARYASLGPKRQPPRRLPANTEQGVHKYERLEDLLREAGYKETRIFTPEATPEPESKKHTSGASFVGFLSSFVVGGGPSRPPPHAEKPVPPPTPSPSPPHRTSSKRSAPIPSPPPSSTPHTDRPVHRQIRVITARHDRPISQAHAYLKHMASVPNLPRRSRSTITPRNAHAGRARRNMDADTPPPLPKSWLETVAHAVLFGGEDAHIGRPLSPLQFTVPPTSPTTSGDQSSSSKDGVSPCKLGNDMQSSFYSTSSQGTSSLFTPSRGRNRDVHIGGRKLTLGDGRGVQCLSTVSMTQVTCRSAPTSRACSRARRERRRNLEQAQEPPCLAKTRTEGDVWGVDSSPLSTKFKRDDQFSIGQRFISGLGHESFTYTEGDSSDSSEGEDELTLDRLLIPPKRQNSIRSLRRHLTLKGSLSDLRRSLRPPTPDVHEEEDDEGEDHDRTWTRHTHGDRKRSGVPRWN